MKIKGLIHVFAFFLVASPVYPQSVSRFQGVTFTQGRIGRVRSVLFSNSNQILASVTKRSVDLWSLGNGGRISEIRTYDGDIEDIAFSMDDRQLVAISSGTLHLWDVATGQEVFNILPGNVNHVSAMAFLPDGQRLIWASWGTVHVFNLTTQREENPLRANAGIINDFDLSENGRLLAVSYRDHTIRIWDMKSGRVGMILGSQGF